MKIYLLGLYDKVDGSFIHFSTINRLNDAIRGFIGSMSVECDLSRFSSDFELYHLGSFDDHGNYTPLESRELLITGIAAKKIAQDQGLIVSDSEPDEQE